MASGGTERTFLDELTDEQGIDPATALAEDKWRRYLGWVVQYDPYSGVGRIRAAVGGIHGTFAFKWADVNNPMEVEKTDSPFSLECGQSATFSIKRAAGEPTDPIVAVALMTTTGKTGWKDAEAFIRHGEERAKQKRERKKQLQKELQQGSDDGEGGGKTL